MPRIKDWRQEWGSGPWEGEPDRLEFEHAGFPCVALRQRAIGVWRGYVGVGHGDPFFGDHPDTISLALHDTDAEPHCGISWASTYVDDIPHDPKRWWIGFCFDSASDINPYILGAFERIGQKDLIDGYNAERTYRDINFTRAALEKLASALRGH